jgi:hypothetical protein
LGELHRETASAEIVPELLAKQRLNVRFIVNHENKQIQSLPPDLALQIPQSQITLNLELKWCDERHSPDACRRIFQN